MAQKETNLIMQESIKEDMAGESTSQTVNISDVSTPESEKTGEEALDVIRSKDPDLSAYFDRLRDTDISDKNTSEILDLIKKIADEEGETVDVSTIQISDAKYAHLFIEDVADLTIPAELDIRITIASDETRLLDDIYTPGLDGYVHLDLRALVLAATDIDLSDHRNATDPTEYQTYKEQDYSGLSLVITTTEGSATTKYELFVNSFRKEAVERMSDIDRIDIPSDAIIPLTVFRDNTVKSTNVSVSMVTGGRRIFLHQGTIADGDGYLVSTDIPVSRLPYRPGEPFYLEFSTNTHTVRTPVYCVVPCEAHQYLFLNDYGNYDLIPMSGALSASHEYEMENAFRTSTIEQTKAVRRPRYTQQSGPLSTTTLKVLSSLLLSRKIYYYTPSAGPRRIVVESPSISLSTNKSINTATFSWRYAEK